MGELGSTWIVFRQRFALSADLRSLTCLQLLPQKQDQLTCPELHLDPTGTRLAKHAVTVAGLVPFTARKLSYRPLFTETSLITASVTLVETAHGRCVHDIRARHTDR